MQMPVEAIIAKFSTQKHLANLISVDQSTIAQWKKRGSIPSNRIQDIIKAAKHAEIPLTYADFFEAA
jgi:ribosomal protein S16